TTTTAASAAASAALVSLMNILKPGVSIRLIFFLFHSAAATLLEMVILRAISSSSKSVTVFPSSTRVRRLVAPPANKAPATREVFPECPCPTNATFRMSFVSYTLTGQILLCEPANRGSYHNREDASEKDTGYLIQSPRCLGFRDAKWRHEVHHVAQRTQ